MPAIGREFQKFERLISKTRVSASPHRGIENPDRRFAVEQRPVLRLNPLMTLRIFALVAVVALFLTALPGRAAEAPTTSVAPSKWEKEIAAFETADREHPPEKGGIVFIGSSSIRLWKTLPQDFPEHRVLNRGFGGSAIADSVEFADRIVFPYEPRMIVMYAGGNDLHSGKSPERVVDDFKSFVGKVRARMPSVKIAYIAISPNPARWAEVEKVKAVNEAIAAYVKDQPHLKFIDTFSKMLGSDGQPLPDIFVADKLHMNAEGYKIWARVVRPFLAP